MKKFLNIFIFALCAAPLFTSCTDESDYIDEPGVETEDGAPLRIVYRETSFDAPGGQGKVEIECDAPYTVNTTDVTDWIKTTTEGNIITLDVAPNVALDGRTCMLEIKSGKYKTRVAVIQAGSFFELKGFENMTVNDNAKTVNVILNTNLEGELQAVAREFTAQGFVASDFITVEMTEAGFDIKISKNTTGHIREGIVVYAYGDYDGTIFIKQVDFAKDIAGEYQFLYNKTSTATALYYMNVKLAKSGNNYTLEFPAKFAYDEPQTYKLPIIFDENTLSVALRSGQSGGNISYTTIDETTNEKVTTDYIVGSCFLSTDGYITWGDYTFPGQIEYVSFTSGNMGYLCEFADNGSWSGKVTNGLATEFFTGTPLSSTTRPKIRIASMYNPFLRRIYSTPATASTQAVSSENGSVEIPARIQEIINKIEIGQKSDLNAKLLEEAELISIEDMIIDDTTAKL